MTPSLQKLLAGIIDYAGLFPPAKLPLDHAIRNYARYRQESDNWMLGRFVCPTAQLGVLLEYVPELFTPDAPLAVSALGSNAATSSEVLNLLSSDLEAIALFRKGASERAAVDVFEVRLPEQGFQELIASGPLSTGRPAIRRIQEAELVPFFESAPGEDWRHHTGALLGIFFALQPWIQFARVGFKLRCGGLTATAFPSVEQVALAMVNCIQGRLPMKFTAGLHHPLRHFDAGLQTHMHGFINVFVAGVLGTVHQLNEEQLQAILADEDASHFHWEADGFSWRDLRASLADIEQARRQQVISFGSCSFDEPRDDLRALGWLS